MAVPAFAALSISQLITLTAQLVTQISRGGGGGGGAFQTLISDLYLWSSHSTVTHGAITCNKIYLLQAKAGYSHSYIRVQTKLICCSKSWLATIDIAIKIHTSKAMVLRSISTLPCQKLQMAHPGLGIFLSSGRCYHFQLSQ